jgi:hypothetical protein
MDISSFIETASRSELEEELCRLAADHSPESLSTLEEFLRYRGRSEVSEGGQLVTTMNTSLPRLAALALLQRGPAGVQSLVRVLREQGPGIFGALWWASKGKHVTNPLDYYLKFETRPELIRPLTEETIQASRDGVNQLIIEARMSPLLFRHILWFLSESFLFEENRELDGIGLDDIYDLMMSGAIKLSRPLLKQFDQMINQSLLEEDYQTFLKQNPVFLDPLAADIIPKQKLGIEMVTDFVLRRYDDKYFLVEIEKPQDRLFTLTNEFTANFTHAFGQVLDFQQWVDSNAAYARVHMPDISSPRGLLVIGRRADMTEENKVKLHRFSINCSAIDIVTFDDLFSNATNLYEAILRKGTLK